MDGCAEKTILAGSLIFGGLTFLLPSALTIYTYLTKWIPEEPDPEKRKNMMLVLGGSVLVGIGIIGGAALYLKNEKCIL